MGDRIYFTIARPPSLDLGHSGSILRPYGLLQPPRRLGRAFKQVYPSFPPSLPPSFLLPSCLLSFRSSSSSPRRFQPPTSPTHQQTNTFTHFFAFYLLPLFRSAERWTEASTGPSSPRRGFRWHLLPLRSSSSSPRRFCKPHRTKNKTHIISPLPLFILSSRCVAQWT